MEIDDPAPVLALATLVVYGTLSVAWRAWLQRRRTGDTGLRLAPGGAAEWSAAALLALGLVLSIAAPAADLAGDVPAVALGGGWSRLAAGAGIAWAGIALTVRAQLDMGGSWRIGVHVDDAAPLVEHGVFARIRNPIFTGVLLAFGGLAVLVPNALALAGWAALVTGLEVQVRLVEEPHLTSVHGERYRAYAARAGRFLPGLGRSPSTSRR